MKVSKNNQKDEIGELERAYAKAFAEYLSMGNEGALHSGYEIGRAAQAYGWGILDMANMHHANIARVVARMNPAVSLAQDLDRAQQFFGESLSPYEMAHRGFRDATSALHRLNEMLEQEIQRIAHVVHDEAGQLLFAARLAMDGVAHELDPSLRSRLQEVGVILDQVEKQLRRLSHELRPTILDDLGLLPALEFLGGRISKRAALAIEIHSTLKDRCAPTIEIAVYRVIQEALTNITKHAHAKNVEIRLRKVAKNLHCLVHDDGVGFDVPSVLSSTIPNGLGLIGMRERLNAVGGTLEIDSLVGRGTDLLVKIPWRSK
ncbi:MAG TPA: ATP-binding protein [Silvibacterium sp.]|jgi:signal transduction histidine kinase|nr:ATP-binding protein [Silvibacterium sp.]